MSEADKLAIELHKKLAGKIEVKLSGGKLCKEDLSLIYTPGVAAVSKMIADQPGLYRDFTGANNSVAIISDGSSVLGLGNIGPKAAMPVMEGKAVLFKHFANINAYPIVLDTQDSEEIISTIKAIAPSFGAINLEDISAPRCFEIEQRLIDELDIPVMHDDQHGTAIVVLAGLINSVKVVGKSLQDCKIILTGSGAAGAAIARLLAEYANCELIMVDSKGAISRQRDDLDYSKRQLVGLTNPNNIAGSLENVIAGADIFIGVSRAGVLTSSMVKSMSRDPIVFALANPKPEIMPDQAINAGAAVVATGRSDFPNQVNNALAFPGVFRGALDNKVHKITTEHKLSSASAIAGLVENPSPGNIIPGIFDDMLVPTVAREIK